MREIALQIEGMHCGSCVRRVTEGLRKLEGVEVKDVVVGRAELELQEPEALERVYATVEKLGFQPLRSTP